LTDASLDLEKLDENAAVAIGTDDVELDRVELGKIDLVDSSGIARIELVCEGDCAGLIDQDPASRHETRWSYTPTETTTALLLVKLEETMTVWESLAEI
jgi:hypothetical protein